MPSLRSRMLYHIIKNSNLLKFRMKQEIIDWDSTYSIIKFRKKCEEGARRFGKIPDDISVSTVSVDGLNGEWIIPSQGPKGKVILFVHGGGYVSGSCADHRIHVSKFVKGAGITALLFDYGLAPENTFPVALDDSVKAYLWLLSLGYSPADIVFAGDSAGGGLCLATLIALKNQGHPMPGAAVAISPWTDLTCSGESYRRNAKKCLSPEGTWAAFSKHYVGDNDPTHPWISPLYGELHGLPPLLIYVGGDEILYDDAVSFGEKAIDAGVSVTLKVGEGLFHCYPVCAPMFPEATEAMEEICDFIKRFLNKK